MPLNALVQIKQRRLQRAEREAQRQRTQLQAAQADKARCMAAHLAFQRDAREEQQRLFAEHVGQLTDRRALQHWHRQVGLLGAHEARLRAEVMVCEDALAQQHTAHVQAQAKLAQARQEHDSFSQLRDQANLRAARVAEHRQELELEECVLQGGGRP
ncbi:type III secretion system stalk subunit SctO [Pseudomonas maumuensis]|uniref:Type III secretion protein n=1 Tax=Pseudomonas maumuensis TaxID=2842354 RepID=A0ABX8NR06_9PSED|nr:YscO family type III secretion system apparatus protein [Pseudomonas maumuensis]QXH58434.1 type III secretion protein [Pseudomonas maumuensis]